MSREAFVWYRGSLTIPADTAQADYASALVEVSPGIISKLYRLFPRGCSGQVFLQVFYQTRQIFPTTPGQSYLGDGSEILGEASIDLDEPEFVLTLRGWSPGTTYDHVVYCEFYIERSIEYVPTVLDLPFVALPDGLESLQ